jgi:hypothetical protein
MKIASNAEDGLNWCEAVMMEILKRVEMIKLPAKLVI